MANSKVIGSVGWIDITVDNPTEIRSFYKQVVGWTETAIPMGEYDDHCMNSPEDGSTYAGICKAEGANRGLPAHWIIYITVADLHASAEGVQRLGGKIIHGPRQIPGQGSYIMIEDPAGAFCALFEHEK